MRQAEPIDPAAPLLSSCQPSLLASHYYNADRYKAELDAIWAKTWVYVGRDKDIPASSLRKVEIAGRNVLLAKDREGATRAFLNSCRHRGAELCPSEGRDLKSRLIVCPYHQWSFSLAGDLVSTPFVSVTDDFRKEDFGLLKVHIKDWNGFLFICLADEPPDFDQVPDVGSHALDNWPMRDLVAGHRVVKELQCNWKVFWENYSECLHCPGIHPELSELVPIYSRGYMAENEAPGWTPDKPAGTALKPGAVTWSMDGSACGPEFPGLSDKEREAGLTFVTLWPSLFVVGHVDYVRAVSMRPLGPERMELRAEWLFAKETLDRPDFDIHHVVDFASLVLSQDADAAEMNQRGLRNPGFRQGILMPQEYEVHRFHEWIRRHIA